MTVESVTYIPDLVTSAPADGEPLSEANEHIQAIKTAVKGSFSNLGQSTVNLPATELNKRAALVSDGATPAAQITLNDNVTQAAAKTALGVSEPALSISGSTITVDSGTTAADIRTALGVTSSSLLDAYPLGAIYMSVVSTPPDTLFGGQWTAIGQGKVLVGLDSGDTDFDTAEAEYGSKTHTLTVDELPSHSHSVTAMKRVVNDDVNTNGSGQLGISSTITSSSVGSNTPHSIVQPSLVVHMWKRVADPS